MCSWKDILKIILLVLINRTSYLPVTLLGHYILGISKKFTLFIIYYKILLPFFSLSFVFISNFKLWIFLSRKLSNLLLRSFDLSAFRSYFVLRNVVFKCFQFSFGEKKTGLAWTYIVLRRILTVFIKIIKLSTVSQIFPL